MTYSPWIPWTIIGWGIVTAAAGAIIVLAWRTGDAIMYAASCYRDSKKRHYRPGATPPTFWSLLRRELREIL